MGDYTGNSWAGNKLFATWTDTRTGVGQDEIDIVKLADISAGIASNSPTSGG